MALVTYPLNKIEYSAEDAELFHATRTSGIYANNSFGYDITGADNNIVIGTGIGWIKNSEFSGKVIAQKEAISLDMGLPDSFYPRIDAIIIQFDANSNETNIVVKKGTAASTPVAPSVVQTESIYELHLYHVRREAGSLYITTGNITDLRLNNSYCGLMADSVTHIDTTAIERQVADLIESLQNEISHVIDGSAYLFRDGSANMTGNLPMDGHKVTGLGTPTADDDAVPLGYANRNYRASSWTPTAEEVGARPSNWVPTAEQVGAAPASSVGTNKVFNKLTDIGITTFPTTMKTVANSMPANSTLMLDSRDIVSGGVHEISDLGATWAGMYMFMRGNSNARLSLLHIYGATGATTSYMNFGCYAATNDEMVWYLGERQNATYPDSRYRIAADGETEWINPPMLAGTEYRTTERWNGKVVYKKLLSWKITSDISGTARYEIPHGITNLDSASLRVDWTTEEWTLPHVNANESLYVSGVDAAKNSTKLVVKSDGNSLWGSGRTFYFYMTYCKTA